MDNNLNTPAILLTTLLTAATPAIADSGNENSSCKKLRSDLTLLREAYLEQQEVNRNSWRDYERHVLAIRDSLVAANDDCACLVDSLQAELKGAWDDYSRLADSLQSANNNLEDTKTERDGLLGRVDYLAQRNFAANVSHNGDGRWGVGLEFSPTPWMSVGLASVFNLNPNATESEGTAVQDTTHFPGGDSVVRTETPIYTERTADIGIIPSVEFYPLSWLSLGYAPAIVSREKTSGSNRVMDTYNPSGEQIRSGGAMVPGTSERHYGLRHGGTAELKRGRFSLGAHYLDKQGWSGKLSFKLFGDTRTKGSRGK